MFPSWKDMIWVYENNFSKLPCRFKYFGSMKWRVYNRSHSMMQRFLFKGFWLDSKTDFSLFSGFSTSQNINFMFYKVQNHLSIAFFKKSDQTPHVRSNFLLCPCVDKMLMSRTLFYICFSCIILFLMTDTCLIYVKDSI